MVDLGPLDCECRSRPAIPRPRSLIQPRFGVESGDRAARLLSSMSGIRLASGVFSTPPRDLAGAFSAGPRGKIIHVAWHLIMRMRWFRSGLAFYYENRGGRILKLTAVAGQLIVRMRRFGLGLAFNCENKDGRILKLTAFEKRLSISELGL